MADFEYVDVNGRQIRVRPRETAQEIDEYGNFHRQPNRFTEGFGEGKNPVEKDRYILFWAKGCNWSNRAAIARELLGLEDAVKVEIVDWTDREENLGWEFVNSPDHINPETGAQFLSELYYNADEEYTGRTTVPAFVDYKTKKVVNNDYHWLTNHLETAFRPFHKKGAPDLYPEELRPEIDKLNKWLFENVNNAVYRAQFAESLQAFADGYETFFAGLDAMEERLADKRFLFGDYVTDSDIPMFLKYINFKCGTNYNVNGVAPIVYAFVALALNESAFNAEIIRASLESVDKGQVEAASALGMNYFQALIRIILPEAIVVALPSLGNAFIGLIKGTSLAFVCSVVEMTAEGKILAGRNYRYFEVYISLAIIYWVITFVLERVISYLEKKLRVPEDAPALLDIRDTEVE